MNLAARVMGEAQRSEIIVARSSLIHHRATSGFGPLGLRHLRDIYRRWSLFVLDTNEPERKDPHLAAVIQEVQYGPTYYQTRAPLGSSS